MIAREQIPTARHKAASQKAQAALRRVAFRWLALASDFASAQGASRRCCGREKFPREYFSEGDRTAFHEAPKEAPRKSPHLVTLG